VKALNSFLLRISIWITTFSCWYPAISFSQVVRETFENLTVSENFDSTSDRWTTLSDAENLFIIQDGAYIMQRKAINAPFAILSTHPETSNAFRMMTAVKIDKSYSEQSFAGLMLMMQPQGQGGFLVEIGTEKRYRVRQIVSGAYRYITGTQKDGGWEKSSVIDDKGGYTTVEIRAVNGDFDLYFNNKFTLTFSERGYSGGSFGYIVGPGTRMKADYFYVFYKGQAATASVTNVDPQPNSETDIILLTESIILLKTEINSLKDENEGLRKTISAMRSGDAEQQVAAKNYEKQVKNLEAEITVLETKTDSLQKVNTELKKYKEMVGANGGGDLVITLSKALKAEKEKNATLQSENKALKEQLTPGRNPGSKSQGTKQPEPKEPASNPSGGITLPVEN
jgi:hypothetical protein